MSFTSVGIWFAGYIAVTFGGYALAGGAAAIAFRPATGLAVVIIVLAGVRAWPIIFAAAVAADALAGREIVAAMAAAAGVVIGAAVTAELTRRFAKGAEAFGDLQSTLRAAVFSYAGAALAAIPAWLLSGVFLETWLSHAIGIIVVAPCLLIPVAAHRDSTASAAAGAPAAAASQAVPARSVAGQNWRGLAERAALFAALAIAALVVFAGWTPSATKTYPLEFICLPFLLWAAYRFGPREMAFAVALLATVAVWGTWRGLGPFAAAAPDEARLLLKGYVTVIAVTGIAFATSIGARRRAEAQLRELAVTDPLTGLVNYRRLLEAMRHEIARSRRTGRPFALLLVDMDGLKRINDRHGHLAGNRALCRIADALRATARETDVISRFGGDEFAVVLPESDDAGGLAVLSRLTERLAGETGPFPISVSGGHAVFPRDGDSTTLLLRAADQRLYEAKRVRRGAA